MNLPLLSVIIPVYNEAQTVESIIKQVISKKCKNYTKEIIVVDDGSTDGTSKIISKIKNIVIIKHAKNEGKGSAIRSALKYVKGELILIQDADLEYLPDNYDILLKPFEHKQIHVVYGSRFLGSHLSTMFLYELGNKFVTFICNILYNTNITDMETGYKVFRRSVLTHFHLESKDLKLNQKLLRFV